ncbi:hypothetical protein FM106_31820 [Brachybacterium faecium]|nr:hypothetical protein FM106_31820 [Brachybacterium faecium]
MKVPIKQFIRNQLKFQSSCSQLYKKNSVLTTMSIHCSVSDKLNQLLRMNQVFLRG